MSFAGLFDFYFAVPRGDQLIGLLILILALTVMAITLYRLVLRNCVKDGIHPSVVMLSVANFSLAVFLLPMRFFHLLSIGGGWTLLAGALLTAMVTVQFAVKKIVPWVGGLILLIVIMVLIVESFGMVR